MYRKLALEIISIVCILSILAPSPIYAADSAEFKPFRGQLVIVYFDNPSGRVELERLTEELPKLLIDELSSRRMVSVMAWDDTVKALSQSGWDPKAAPDKDKILSVVEALGGDAALLGSYLPLGRGLIVFARIYEAKTGSLLAETDVGGPGEKTTAEIITDLASAIESKLTQPQPEDSSPKIKLHPLMGTVLSILSPGSGQFYVRKPWDGLFYYLVGTFIIANLVRYWGIYQIRPSDGQKVVVESWLWGLIWITFLATFDAYAEANLYNYNIQKYKPPTEETPSSETQETTEPSSVEREESQR